MWLDKIGYRMGQVGQQLGFVAPLQAEEYREVARWLPDAAVALFKTMSAADQRHSLRVCRGLQAHGCTNEDMLAAALLHDVGKGRGRVPFWTRPAIVLGKRLAPRLLARLVTYPGIDEEFAGAQLMRPLPHVPTNKGLMMVIHKIVRASHRADQSAVVFPLPQRGWMNRPLRGLRRVSGYLDYFLKSHNWAVTGWRRSLSYAWYHAEVGAELAAAAGLSQRAVLYIRTHHLPEGPARELHEVDEVS